MSIRAALFVSICAFVFASITAAAPVDLSPPPNALGYADGEGNLKAIYKFGEIRFSDGFVLPLRFDFSSQRAVEAKTNKIPSPFGWTGWHCGPLESSAEFYGGKKFIRATLLCSKILFLEQSKEDANTYLSLGGSWTGKVEGDLLSITRADGWDLRFLKGQVLSLRTDSGLLIEWQRDEKGRLLAIKEKDQPLSGVTVQWAAWPDGAPRVASIVSDRSPASELRSPAAASLAAFTYRDGAGDAPGSARTLSGVTNAASRSGFQFLQKADSLRVDDQEGRSRLFTWNPENGRLLNDGMNRYRTLASKTDPAAPRLVEMTNPKGESMARSLDAKGDETLIYPGKRSVTTVKFPQGSPAFGQIRQMIENIPQPDGKPDQQLVLMENTFDEEGKLIKRTWRADPVQYKTYQYGRIEPVFLPDQGTVFDVEEEKSIARDEPLRTIEYGYDAEKRHVLTKVDGKEVYRAEYAADGKGGTVTLAGRFSRKTKVSPAGERTVTLQLHGRRENDRFFYVGHDDPSISAAMVVESRFDSQGRLASRAFLDGRTQKVVVDDKGRTQSVATYAPDRKTIIQNDRYVYNPQNGQILLIMEDTLNGNISHMQVGRNGETGRWVARDAASHPNL